MLANESLAGKSNPWWAFAIHVGMKNRSVLSPAENCFAYSSTDALKKWMFDPLHFLSYSKFYFIVISATN